MKEIDNTLSISVLNESVSIEDRPGNANPWALVDNQTGDEIAVCPEEVPSMIALFRSFRRSIEKSDNPRSQIPDHDCTGHTVPHDVGGLDDPISECTICGNMTSIS
jgi:hypothetical protein